MNFLFIEVKNLNKMNNCFVIVLYFNKKITGIMSKINFIIVLGFLSLVNLSLAQSIHLTGTIYEAEFTPDNKISGLFTYMNNTPLSLQLEVIKTGSGGHEIALQRTVESQRGRQLRVFEQQFTSGEEQVFGDYIVSFYVIRNGVKSDLVLEYENSTQFAPNLRVVSVMFNAVKEDDFGKYIEVRIDWQTIREGTATDIRKCYLGNL